MSFLPIIVVTLLAVGVFEIYGLMDETMFLMCSPDMKPVCAINDDGDYKTFLNVCSMRKAGHGWSFHSLGFCEQSVQANPALATESCEPSCPQTYRPVCASNPYDGSLTFTNNCSLEVTQRRERMHEWTILNLGQCEILPPNRCRKFCPRIYQPLCATDMYEFQQTLHNKCEFTKAKCLQPERKWRIAHAGECQAAADKLATPCPQTCLHSREEVCGVNEGGKMVTFSSACFLQSLACERGASEMWRVLKPGKCEESKEACRKGCPMIYQPVCAADMFQNERTFSNTCLLREQNCSEPAKRWSVLRQGKCNSTDRNPNKKRKTGHSHDIILP